MFGETVSTLTATADTPTTSVVFLTGDVLFTAEDGTLLFKEASALRTTGPR